MKKISGTEEGDAMPSVRSRIKQFESLTGENDKGSEEPNKTSKRECVCNVDVFICNDQP